MNEELINSTFKKHKKLLKESLHLDDAVVEPNGIQNKSSKESVSVPSLVKQLQSDVLNSEYMEEFLENAKLSERIALAMLNWILAGMKAGESVGTFSGGRDNFFQEINRLKINIEKNMNDIGIILSKFK